MRKSQGKWNGFEIDQKCEVGAGIAIGLRIRWTLLSFWLLLGFIGPAKAVQWNNHAHPRILLFQEDENALWNKIDNDSGVLKKASERIMTTSNDYLTQPVLGFGSADPKRLGNPTELLKRVFYLSYAYRKTKDIKYANRAVTEMLNAANWTHWNHANTFLDTAVILMAMGIGYDWLYGVISSPDRDTIRSAIINKGLVWSNSTTNTITWWKTSQSNWNQVCNAGIVFGALAVYEGYPESSQQIIDDALTSIGKPMSVMEPHGSYPEGFGYYNYGMTYNVLLLEAVKKLGGAYQTYTYPSFWSSAEWAVQMVGPTGMNFNFSDNSETVALSPLISAWFTRELGRRDLLWSRRAIFNGTSSVPGSSELPAFLVVAKDLDFTSAIPSPATTFRVYGGPQSVALMRTSFTDPDATFVGIKGGIPGYPHSHMDVGSFVLDSNGERWVSDLGAESYPAAEANLGGFWNYAQDSQRWNVYREGNSSHNVLKIYNDKQFVTGNAQIILTEWNAERLGVAIDTQSIHKPGTLVAAKRHCYLYNKTTSLQDQIITGSVGKTAKWQFITSATVRISNNVVTLTKNGKTMVVTLGKNYGDVAGLRPAKGAAVPTTTWENQNSGYTRVYFSEVIPPYTNAWFTATFVPVDYDSTKPSVSLTAPVAGTTYTTPQSVPITAAASDNVAVKKVWFILDGVTISTDTTTPYAYSWPITGAKNGAHTWKATAFDAFGNSVTTPGIRVTVNIDAQKPSIRLTTPEANSLFTTPQRVRVVAGASDNVGVTKVWFTRNGVVVSTDASAPYEYSWPITVADNGAYNWTATAFDAIGNSSTTAIVPVTVAIPNDVMGLANPGFEERDSLHAGMAAGWTRYASGAGVGRTEETGFYRSGVAGLAVPTDPDTHAWQYVQQGWRNYQPNSVYQVSFWGKVLATSGLVGRVNIGTIREDGAYNSTVVAVNFAESEWTKYAVTFSTDAVSAQGLAIRCWQNNKDLAGSVYLDDFSIATVTMPSGIPGAPTEVNAIPGPRSLTVSWQAPAGLVVDSYRVFVSTKSNFSLHTPGWYNKDAHAMTRVRVNDLEDYTTYYVRVRAYNRVGGISIYSDTAGARTLDTTPPNSPILSGSSYGQNMALTWTDSIDGGTGLAGYEVDVSSDAGLSSFIAGWENRDVGSTTSVTLDGLSGGTTYYAQVRAYDGAGNRSENSNRLKQRAAGLANPGFEAVDPAHADLPAGWAKYGSAAGIARSEINGNFHGGTAGLVVPTPPSTGASQFVQQAWKGYQPNTAYQLSFWGRVLSTSGLRGRVNIGTTREDGAYKSTVELIYFSDSEWTKYAVTFSTDAASAQGLMVRCWQDNATLAGTVYFDDYSITAVTRPSGPPQAPSDVTMTSGPGTIGLSWTEPNSLVDSYRVDLSTSSHFASYATGWRNRDVGHMNSVRITGLTVNGMYYARVRAYNKIGGTSAPSNIPNITLTGAHAAAALTPPLAPDTVDGARAYPVPFRPGYGATGITFDRIPAETTVRIYTIDGRPVKNLTTNTEGSVLWDLTNDDGSPVASGVYLAIMEKNGGRKRLKVVVQK